MKNVYDIITVSTQTKGFDIWANKTIYSYKFYNLDDIDWVELYNKIVMKDEGRNDAISLINNKIEEDEIDI